MLNAFAPPAASVPPTSVSAIRPSEGRCLDGDEHRRHRRHEQQLDDARLGEGDVGLQRVGDVAESRVSLDMRRERRRSSFPRDYCSNPLTEKSASRLADRYASDVAAAIRSLARSSSASSSSGASALPIAEREKLVGEPGVASEHRTVQVGAEDPTRAGAVGAVAVADARHHRSERLDAGSPRCPPGVVLESGGYPTEVVADDDVADRPRLCPGRW